MLSVLRPKDGRLAKNGAPNRKEEND
jgi:hypothetical protein